MLSNSVTRQVSFNRTKIGRKCQNSNFQIFKCDNLSNFQTMCSRLSKFLFKTLDTPRTAIKNPFLLKIVSNRVFHSYTSYVFGVETASSLVCGGPYSSSGDIFHTGNNSWCDFFRTIWWRQQQSLITTLVGFLQLFDGYFFRARHFTVLLTKKNSEKMESSKKVEEVALKSLS